MSEKKINFYDFLKIISGFINQINNNLEKESANFRNIENVKLSIDFTNYVEENRIDNFNFINEKYFYGCLKWNLISINKSNVKTTIEEVVYLDNVDIEILENNASKNTYTIKSDLLKILWEYLCFYDYDNTSEEEKHYNQLIDNKINSFIISIE